MAAHAPCSARSTSCSPTSIRERSKTTSSGERGPLKAVQNGVKLALWVSPRGRRDELVGVAEGRLRVRLQAPPHEGRANAALVRFVAGRLRVAPSDVVIVGGATSRRKVLRVRGVTLNDAQQLLRLERS